MLEATPLRLAVAFLMAACIVIVGVIIYLSAGSPDHAAEDMDYPASGLNFAFGSGHGQKEHMVVDGFANGYALLSSGTVSIMADSYKVMGYSWLPAGTAGETAFFWRQEGKAETVIRKELTVVGKRLLDLSAEPGWRGEIIEFGFLVAGQQGESIELGKISFSGNSLGNRLQMMWQAWTTFEQRSQQSINFIQGGEAQPVVSLPLLVMIWLFVVMLLLRFLPGQKPDSPFVLLAGLLLLTGWMVLDIRWTINSYRQTSVSLQAPPNSNLDDTLQEYVQRLKTQVIGEKISRILIVGEENAIDYYLYRAKYHFLPHSAVVVGRFNRQLTPGTVAYVVYFGPPGSITKLPGWSQAWRSALVEIDRGDWGVVYRVDS